MIRPYRCFSAILLAGSLAAPVLITGCAVRTYRVHDVDHDDYHRWDANEDRYYRQWEIEVRLDHHEFRDRDRDEQKRYWDWRHRHGDRDHDRDRDKDKDRH